MGMLFTFASITISTQFMSIQTLGLVNPCMNTMESTPQLPKGVNSEDHYDWLSPVGFEALIHRSGGTFFIR